MYDVNGLPSMVMSTRRCASSGTTCTPEVLAALSGWVGVRRAAARATTASLRINLASNHHVLRLVVEGDFLAGLNRSHIHAEGNGVAVAGLNGSVGRFARAQALHPVAHVRRGLRVGVRVGGGGDGFFGAIEKREAGQKVRLHLHLGSIFF